MRPGGAEAGFSLVELLISLALTGMVMALAMPFAHLQKRLWERHEERREAVRALAGALAWLTRDLQQAGYHEPASPIRLLERGKLAYLLSRDEDEPSRFSPANRRLITVWLEGRDLKYRIQAPLAPPAAGWERGSTQVLASGVTGMQCRGLNGRGDETAAAERVTLVECAFSGVGGLRENLVVRLRSGGRGAEP